MGYSIVQYTILQEKYSHNFKNLYKKNVYFNESNAAIPCDVRYPLLMLITRFGAKFKIYFYNI